MVIEFLHIYVSKHEINSWVMHGRPLGGGKSGSCPPPWFRQGVANFSIKICVIIKLLLVKKNLKKIQLRRAYVNSQFNNIHIAPPPVKKPMGALGEWSSWGISCLFSACLQITLLSFIFDEFYRTIMYCHICHLHFLVIGEWATVGYNDWQGGGNCSEIQSLTSYLLNFIPYLFTWPIYILHDLNL